VESTGAVGQARASGDDALVGRAAAGETAAFEMLLSTRLDRCYRLAYAILGDASDAADATQEGFVSAWRARLLLNADVAKTADPAEVGEFGRPTDQRPTGPRMDHRTDV